MAREPRGGEPEKIPRNEDFFHEGKSTSLELGGHESEESSQK